MLDCLPRIEELSIEFPTDDGLVVAVDGLDLSVGRGRAVGLVGESGCGKSVTGRTKAVAVPWKDSSR